MAVDPAQDVQIFAETERLVLRRFTTDDVDNLVDLDGDPAVMLRINGGRPTPRAEIEGDYLPAFLGYYRRFAGYGFWAVIEKATGEFLGWVHFRPQQHDDADDPELGYRLKKSAWGKGFAAEASRAVIDRGFRDFGVRRVHAETMAVHTGSRRVMEKCGLHLVRTFQAEWPDPIPGDEHGDVEYAITRQQWETGRTAKRSG